MAKIVIIGAGSGFGSRLSIDILSREPLRDATIALCDTHEGRVTKVTDYVKRAVEGHNLPATVLSSTDRKELLTDADFVITSVSIGGAAYWGEPYASEILIPREYGVDQMVGDTIGPGGVFRFLRTAPEHLAFCKDMEQLCPGALMLNYTNPMAMLTWLHSTGSSVRNTGLCHSVQGTARRLAKFLDVPFEEVSYLVAGINHQSWFLKYRHLGVDMYPRLHELLDDEDTYWQEPIRFELMRHFGYFPTESSGHNSEYVPYFRRTPEVMEQYRLKSREVSMQPWKEREWLKDTGVAENAEAEIPPLERSHEYASAIIEAEITGEPLAFNGNVMNNGVISNLPAGCCVEVPCLVDKEGVHPCYVGELPAQCAAINRTNIAVEELAVQAALQKDKAAAFHAVALDPLTAATVPLDKIREMFDRMWEAEGDLLSYFDD